MEYLCNVADRHMSVEEREWEKSKTYNHQLTIIDATRAYAHPCQSQPKFKFVYKQRRRLKPQQEIDICSLKRYEGKSVEVRD